MTEPGESAALQPAIPGVPVGTTAPQPYVSAQDAMQYLSQRWGQEVTLADGHVLVASMRLDEEGPFQGVKLITTQEREWPRTFKYGWPNVISAPSPVMVDVQQPGAWYLNYEGVVPQQIVDWVCLEAWRIVSLPWDRMTTQESVTGASVHYAPPPGAHGGMAAMIDEAMAALVSPFQVRSGHLSAFVNFTNL